jgi:hypothetical protein
MPALPPGASGPSRGHRLLRRWWDAGWTVLLRPSGSTRVRAGALPKAPNGGERRLEGGRMIRP